MNCRAIRCVSLAAMILVFAGGQSGCPQPTPPSLIVPTDETNYVGSTACGSCHSNVAATHVRTGHAQALKQVLNGGPVYPVGPGVPDPPLGFDWSQISYVVGGYEKAATFIDLNGFVLTTGTTGVDTQFNQAVPPVDIGAGFVPYLADRTTPLPFEFGEFFRRTTGALSLTDNGGLRQDHRLEIEGTWAQVGVQCEACHGPGSRHVPNPSAGNIQLDANSASCNSCHGNPGQPGVVAASDELILGFQQTAELEASPHQGFNCNVCHDPHASVFHDRATAIRNECQVCHPDHNMALHEGVVFRRGDYSEVLSCTSCHMPYTVRTFASNDIQLTNGRTVRLGDTRSHIFQLNPTEAAQMFTPGGSRLALDEEGKASISTCYVCQRCHTGQGNAFAFPPDEGCGFGSGIHAR